ncbi:MAG: zinc-binding dehydrogenase [Rubrivivax sp.]
MSDAEGALAGCRWRCIAVRRAGPLRRRVLVTGWWPIGALLVMAARRAGAAHVVATDVAAAPLRTAANVGADEAINAADDPQALAKYTADKGSFDVLLEASGNERAARRLRRAGARAA